MATTVLLFYKYADISGKVPEVAQWQRELCTRLKLEGRILLADEGINGSLSGPAEVVQQYCDALSTSQYFAKAHAEEPIDFKTSTTDEQVLFPGLSVKQVASICGGGNIAKAPLELGGKHLTPREWHEALQRQDADNAVLLDCRNDYEYAIGRFQGAVDPGTRHFHEFADYVDKHKDQWKKEGKKVLMYCTGGIRCEKVCRWLPAVATKTKQWSSIGQGCSCCMPCEASESENCAQYSFRANRQLHISVVVTLGFTCIYVLCAWSH